MAGTVEKGITVTFRADTAEFDSGVEGVNRQLGGLEKELSQLNKDLKLDPTNVDKLRDKFKNLKSQEELLVKKLEEYEEALANTSKEELGAKEWKKLQKEIKQTEKDLAGVRRALSQIDESSLQGLGAIGLRLQSLGAGMEKLGGQMKIVSAAAGALATGMAALTYDVAQQADDINTLAKQYNLSTEQIQQFKKASDLVDVSLETITKSYAKLTKNLTSTSKETVGAFETLGVATVDVNGELRDSNDVFNEVIRGLAEIENETLQDNLAMQIFGKSAADLGPLINGGFEQLEDINEYLKENALILSQDELDSLNLFNDAIDTIKLTLNGFKEKIAVALAPMLTSVSEKINTIILKVKEWFDTLSPSTVQLIAVLSGVVATIAPILLVGGKISKLVGSLLTDIAGTGGLTNALGLMTNPITVLIGVFALLFATSEEFRNGVIALVKEIVKDLQPVISKLATFLQNTLKLAFKVVIDILKTLGDIIARTVLPIIKKLWEFFSDNLIPIFTSLVDVINDKVIPIVEKLYNWFKDNIIPIFEDVIETIGEFLIPIIDSLFSAFETIVNIIKDDVIPQVEKLYNWFKDNIYPIVDTVADILKNTLAVAFDTVKSAVEKVSGVVETVVDWFQNLWDKIKDTQVMKDLGTVFDSIGSKIESLIGWIKSAVDWFGSMIGKAKDFLGLETGIDRTASKLNSGSVSASSSRRTTSSKTGTRAVAFVDGSGSTLRSGALGINGVNLSTNIHVNNNGTPIDEVEINRWVGVMVNKLDSALGRRM